MLLLPRLYLQYLRCNRYQLHWLMAATLLIINDFLFSVMHQFMGSLRQPLCELMTLLMHYFKMYHQEILESGATRYIISCKSPAPWTVFIIYLHFVFVSDNTNQSMYSINVYIVLLRPHSSGNINESKIKIIIMIKY